MALKRERIVKEDLELGYGTKTVTRDSGGSQTGHKVGLHTLLDSAYNVKAFGAVGDGVTDDRAAIATAVAAARGGTLYFPDGLYRIDTDGGSITTEEVTFVGSGVLDGASATVDQGAVLNIVGTTNSPFSVRRGTSFRGMGFYYPDQTDSASPTAYPQTLAFDYSGSGASVQYVYIDSCVAFNAYRFIGISDAATGHIWITNNTIYGIHRCIEITDNAEIIKIHGNTFTFGHWADATEAGARAYTRASGIVATIDDSDGISWKDNLFFGYLKGLSYQGTSGVALQQNISGNFFDQVRYPISTTGSAALNQSPITGNTFFAFNSADTTVEGIGVYLDGTGASSGLTISANYFAQTTSDHIKITQSGSGLLTVCGNAMEYPAHSRSSGSYACLTMDASNSSVNFTGNHCLGQNNAFSTGVIITSCTAVAITNNVFSVCQNAVSVASAIDLMVQGNLSRGTVASVSDSLSGATGNVINVGNMWDKPAGNSPVALANDATPSVAIAVYDEGNHRFFLTGGTTTITDFDDGWTGLRITIIAEHNVTITDGTNIFLSGSANFAMNATDTLTLIQKADGLWYEIARSDNA